MLLYRFTRIAGLCEDPKDYRYCGYPEAIAKNSTQAKLGLKEPLGLGRESSWQKARREYRKLLFQTGRAASKAGAVIDEELAQKVLQHQQGEIPLAELLRWLAGSPSAGRPFRQFVLIILVSIVIA